MNVRICGLFALVCAFVVPSVASGQGFASLLLQSETKEHQLNFPAQLSIVAKSAITGRQLGSAHMGVTPIATPHVGLDMLFSIDNVEWRDERVKDANHVFCALAFIPVVATDAEVACFHPLIPAATDDEKMEKRKQPTAFRLSLRPGELPAGSYMMKIRLYLARRTVTCFVLHKRSGQAGYSTFQLDIKQTVEPNGDLAAMRELQGFNELLDEATANQMQVDDHRRINRREEPRERNRPAEPVSKLREDYYLYHPKNGSDRDFTYNRAPKEASSESSEKDTVNGTQTVDKSTPSGATIRCLEYETKVSVPLAGLVLMQVSNSHLEHVAGETPFGKDSPEGNEEVGKFDWQDGFQSLATFAPGKGEGFFPLSTGRELWVKAWGVLQDRSGQWNSWGRPTIYHIFPDGRAECVWHDGSTHAVTQDRRGYLFDLYYSDKKGS